MAPKQIFLRECRRKRQELAKQQERESKSIQDYFNLLENFKITSRSPLGIDYSLSSRPKSVPSSGIDT
jgi:hypothetical protein